MLGDYRLFAKFNKNCRVPSNVGLPVSFVAPPCLTQKNDGRLVVQGRFRHKNGSGLREEEIDIDDLDPHRPAMNDLALVVAGEDIGKIYRTERIIRDKTSKKIIGLRCRHIPPRCGEFLELSSDCLTKIERVTDHDP